MSNTALGAKIEQAQLAERAAHTVTINKNGSEECKKELMDSLKIRDYKDADIIATQYQIDIKK